MIWAEKIYDLAIKLYPPSFQKRFAGEMNMVFNLGLEEARQQGNEVRYLLREAFHLPVSLADVYVWSMRMEEEGQMAVSGAGGSNSGFSQPREGWLALFLAGLPHLLFGLFFISSTLVGEFATASFPLVETVGTIFIGLAVLLVLVYNLKKGWQPWSASWLMYIVMLSFILLISLASELSPTYSASINDTLSFILFPLILAYSLYKITARNKISGLLAAIPPAAALGIPLDEFVSDLPESVALAIFSLAAFLAAILILRARRFSTALGVALAVPALSGFVFSAVGEYFVDQSVIMMPAPRLSDVFNTYLSIIGLSFAVILGPLLAVHLRELGHQSAGLNGKVYYRLALAGVLVGSFLALFIQAMDGTAGPEWFIQLLINRPVLLVAAIGLYSAGFIFLARATWNSLPQTRWRLIGLFILLPGVPLMLAMNLANTFNGIPLNGWLQAAQLVWALAAWWFVGHEHKQS